MAEELKFASTKEFLRLNVRGYRALRRQWAAQFRDTAKRLAGAYEDVLDNLAPHLRRLEDEIVNVDSTLAISQRRSFLNLQRALQTELDDMQSLIRREAAKMQRSGLDAVPALVLGAFRAEGIGTIFNMPSPAMLRELVNFVDNPIFRGRLSQYGETHAQYIANIILSDASLGKAPLAAVRHVINYVAGMPRHDAVRMCRTVQVYAAREGTRETYRQNQDIVLGWIWSSALDARTCMSCLAMHGKKFSLDMPLGDHYHGRCAMRPMTWLNEDAPVLSGEEWFRSRSEEEQQRQMGRARWRAWMDGEFEFSALSVPYEDDLYGTMYHTPSLRQIRGRAA